MIARAIAKEANATFIPIKASSINQKYVGEGEKMISAVFSLARKLAPSGTHHIPSFHTETSSFTHRSQKLIVLFMDEFDTLFGDRDAMASGSHPYASKYLGVMLSEWDGLQEASKAPVLVLAATNRPQDIDQAFLRRLPMSIETKPPNAAGRADILSKMLSQDAVAPDVDFKEVAARTKRYTGSDLRELIRLVRLEMMKSLWANIDEIPESYTTPVGGGESIEDLAIISRKHFETGNDNNDKNDIIF